MAWKHAVRTLDFSKPSHGKTRQLIAECRRLVEEIKAGRNVWELEGDERETVDALNNLSPPPWLILEQAAALRSKRIQPETRDAQRPKGSERIYVSLYVPNRPRQHGYTPSS